MSDNLPFDEQAERAMIGCITGRADLMDDFRLDPEHFFHFGHRAVFESALAIHCTGQPVNLHTLSCGLSEVLPKIGGLTGLSDMLRAVVATSAPTLFDRLDALKTLRKAQGAVSWANTALRDAIQTTDPVPFCDEFRRRVFDLDEAGAEESILGKVVGEIHAKLDRMDKGEKWTGFKTSIDLWNSSFGGVCDGQFYAIAGRPGRGKTAMAEQIASDYMAEGIPIVFFEKDMAPQKLVERLACRALGIPFWKLMRNILGPEDRNKLRIITREIAKDDTLRLYSPAGLTAEQMCAIMRREIRRGAKCGILDHVQTLKVGRDMREGLTQASLTMRRHVTDTNVPFIALAHLNRDAGDARPSANNIKEFDQLYGDVDALLLLWYTADQADQSVKEIQFTVAKNRDFNETEETIIFDGSLMKFKGKKA